MIWYPYQQMKTMKEPYKIIDAQGVWLKTPEGDVLVPLSQIQPGDLVPVRMGGLVPLDGVIEAGEVMVNQASLTGESLPAQERQESFHEMMEVALETALRMAGR